MKQEPNPFKRFSDLYAQIQVTDIAEPSAMTLATANADGRPSARVVLLKSFDENGFVFYTNLESRKAIELRENPQAELCFYWEPISHQVRISGPAFPVSDKEADDYFASRPRGSQIGAWASLQSSVLSERRELLERYRQLEEKYEGKVVPRPPFWSGFRLIPDHFEFWKRYENRLHERSLYTLSNDRWQVVLLYP